MLAKAPDALKADFQRFYGLNPDLMWTGGLTPTYTAALAACLPRQAVIWRELDPRLAWDDQTYLLADIRDFLGFLAWTKTKDASRKGAGADNSNAPAPSGMKPRAARSWRWTTNN